MRQEKLYKKPSSIVNSIQKRCLNKGKFTTATTLIKKSLQQTLIISKKSNPHLEMQRTLSSKLLIDFNANGKNYIQKEKNHMVSFKNLFPSKKKTHFFGNQLFLESISTKKNLFKDEQKKKDFYTKLNIQILRKR
uniref:hypothetical protein n=1 Tax=Ancyromonas sigmoides TaxID=85707 RepID=UPI0028D11DD8|nr:hypothetical protein RU994_mgp11 [Ancyromonas sigmoides]WMQ52565.1 hypothetical protein [Ancyromonas sigmoides]